MYLLRAFIWALKPGFSLRLVVLLFLENHLQLRGWCSDWQVSGYVIKRQIQLFVCLGYCLLLVLTTGNWLYTGRFSSKICNVQVVCSLWPLGGGEEGGIYTRKEGTQDSTVCDRLHATTWLLHEKWLIFTSIVSANKCACSGLQGKGRHICSRSC